MSLNIGNGFITAHITEQRLQSIKESTLPLEMSLWEKIKDFFCHAQHETALNCLHRLYHHESLKLSEDDIRETFLQLKYLASPGCRNRFFIDKNNDEYIYKINDEIIFSKAINNSICSVNQGNDPRLAISSADDRSYNNYDGDYFYDCNDDYRDCNDDYHDCIDDPNTHLLQQEKDLDEYEIAPATKTIVVEREDRVLDIAECLSILMPEIKSTVNNMNLSDAKKVLGLWDSAKALSHGKQLLKFLDSSEVNYDKVKEEFKILLNLKGFEGLIPSRIREMPEYAFVHQLCLSS